MAYARQMLFLALLYDPKITSRTEKAKMFLEILGNVELRESTFKVKNFAEKMHQLSCCSACGFFSLSLLF